MSEILDLLPIPEERDFPPGHSEARRAALVARSPCGAIRSSCAACGAQRRRQGLAFAARHLRARRRAAHARLLHAAAAGAEGSRGVPGRRGHGPDRGRTCATRGVGSLKHEAGRGGRSARAGAAPGRMRRLAPVFGSEVVFRASPESTSQPITPQGMQLARQIMEGRLQKLGVSSPTVAVKDGNELVVQFAGVPSAASGRGDGRRRNRPAPDLRLRAEPRAADR